MARRVAITVSFAFTLFQAVTVTNARGQEATVKVDAVSVSLGGRLQTQFNTTSVDSEPRSELFIRRARLELEVKVDDLVSGVLVPEFAGSSVALKDAYLNLAFSPGAEIRIGNAHRPFSRIELTSSKRMPVIERGLRLRGVEAFDEYGLVNGLDYSDRDVGIQIHGEPDGAPMGLNYAAGVFRGPLHGQVGARDSYQWAARGTIAPAPDLRIGAGWSSRHFASGAPESLELDRGNAFEVDAEYGGFRPGIHLIAEVAHGDISPIDGTTFVAAQGWLAFRTGEINRKISAIEPILRVSHADVRDQVIGAPDGGTLITPGINLYLTPLNRIMLNYDIWRGGGDATDAGGLKAMFQFAF
jgi:hypothetical protein